MSYYNKVKKDFSFRKIKFKGIECYQGDGTAINVTTTGTAQMIRQILKNQWAIYNSQGTWVKTRKFANGDAIDVYLNRVPDDIYKAIKSDLEVFDEYPVNHNNAKKIVIKTEDGILIDAGTKYLHLKNEPPYDSKEKDEPAPDWEKILNKKEKPTETPKPKSSGNSRFDKGELLKECSGWDIYKKTLPDGRVVYNAYKKKETSPNKEDWNLIKGDIYINTGFKWGRFGFEKWGQIASEAMVIQTLCNLFAKYYGGKEEPNEETPKQPNIPKFKVGDLVVVKKYGWVMRLVSINDFYFLENDKDGTMNGNEGGYEEGDLELYQTQTIELSNEQINKLIKALSYLADEGDETAKKKMKAYKYLLN